MKSKSVFEALPHEGQQHITLPVFITRSQLHERDEKIRIWSEKIHLKPPEKARKST